MNTVKFYHRDTGKLHRVRIVQHRRGLYGAKYHTLRITERAMANAGYFRKRPKI